MAVSWQSVESTNINQIGYDAGTQELSVRFNSGAEYVYKDVPGSVYADFLDSDSKGKFLNENIKSQYEYARV
ncbi:hypothetical protein LCGC14_1062860 [marine sediment metagenome]|uniref:KTSC domain-containing protein n=1 Tax=marine sediment metagenome TaxID=412755 RepID=A0A0F9QRJ7_9ZZZZ